MMDIGCYCVSFARYLFDAEPQSVSAMVEYDPVFGTDRIASGLLQFASGTSSFTCSTQLMPYQRVNILGTEGRIEVDIPVNTPPDKKTRIVLHTKQDSKEIFFDAVDQYTLQGDAFAKAISTNSAVPTPLEDAVANMKVIEAVFKSANTKSWVQL
jgi:predicted dehydrogenase